MVMVHKIFNDIILVLKMLEEEEDIFVSRQLYNMVNILSLSSGLARPRDVVGALLQSTFKDYTQCSRIS